MRITCNIDIFLFADRL